MYRIINKVESNSFIPYLECDIVVKLKDLISNYGLKDYFFNGDVYTLSTFKKNKEGYTFTGKNTNGDVFDVIFDEKDLHGEYTCHFGRSGESQAQFYPYNQNIRSYIVLEVPFPAIKNPNYCSIITNDQIL
jgi:hypothetical protein